VTYHILGVVVRVTDGEIVLNKASWVADSGRLGESMSTGVVSESEFLGDGVVVFRGAAVDALPWRRALPVESK
jgi:hypothetical protein